MAILSVTTDFTGEVGVSPRLVRMLTSDSYETVTAENYLQSAISMGYTFFPNDLVELTYGTNSDTTKIFSLSISSGSITLIPPQGSVSGSTTANDIAIFADTSGTLEDSGININNVPTVSGTPSAASVAYWTGTGKQLGVSQVDINGVIISTSTSGQSVSVTASSATPGNITSFSSNISNTATTQTSGTLIGLAGVASVPSGTTASANAAFYGVQGTCVVNGTVNSANAIISGLRGSLDIS